MKRNGSDVVNALFALHRFLIQALDVAESVRKTQARNLDLVRRKTIEHECIVGIGAMGDSNFTSGGGESGHESIVPLIALVRAALVPEGTRRSWHRFPALPCRTFYDVAARLVDRRIIRSIA